MAQMKELDKITATDLIKMEISNITDRELKILIIKILLDSRKEWRTSGKPLKREKKKKQSQMKNTINKIIKTPNGIKSRLKKADE